MRLFATDQWREIAQLAPQAGRVDAFAFSPDGTLLATLSEPSELTVWNAADGTPRTTFTGKGTEGGIPVAEAALAFSRDGRRIASSLGAIVNLGGRSAVTLNLEQGPEVHVEHMEFTMCDAKLYVRSYSRAPVRELADSKASRDPGQRRHDEDAQRRTHQHSGRTTERRSRNGIADGQPQSLRFVR